MVLILPIPASLKSSATTKILCWTAVAIFRYHVCPLVFWLNQGATSMVFGHGKPAYVTELSRFGDEKTVLRQLFTNRP